MICTQKHHAQNVHAKTSLIFLFISHFPRFSFSLSLFEKILSERSNICFRKSQMAEKRKACGSTRCQPQNRWDVTEKRSKVPDQQPSKSQQVPAPTALTMVESHFPSSVAYVVCEYSGDKYVVRKSDSRFQYKKEQWLTQWFDNRQHFHSLMRTQGFAMMHANQNFYDEVVVKQNKIWLLFDRLEQVHMSSESADLTRRELVCLSLHPEHQGVPYFQCAQCHPLHREDRPTKISQRDARWYAFVNKHLDLILSYLKQLPTKSQIKLAQCLSENWLEGDRMYVH